MAWLFERTVEMAAWIAMLMAWIAAGWAAYLAITWFKVRSDEIVAWQCFQHCAIAAAACVGFSVALGALACVDRFLFDAGEV
ncbi:hypothetical protein Pla175_42570 [Pirellulimonas nuda]|uniref:Uncharacterized protein n=1 Tax=Pirellulimonas nuda TaxID=2528009 RepID=A0A518DH98_9BACT|nr:hypothetical protein [Pirellulimonas nuda]QDU90844.1 hypothetical protein Pla175_42570 [Pirellulimonas nuda]